MKSGKVFLVGAGPGDLGLITLKAMDCIGNADTIVYDRLLDDRLLDNARQDAEKIYVGKSSSKHTMSQNEINDLLVRKAKEGKNIVRLKGGDPFVFGRGGEEAQELARNEIIFEVVPGVTSAIAVPAYAGIPVTHRGLASSFAVLTGHEDPVKNGSTIQWAKLATGVDTLIFLMAMQNLTEIVEKLVEHGKAVDTPVAVVKDGTGPQQKTVVGTLGDIISRVKGLGMMPPAVVVVGEVINLRETLQWFDNRPLFGKRILITRAKHQASSLSKMFAERGASPVELPAIIIRPMNDNPELKHAILDLERYQWLVFTSVNGVEFFFDYLRNLKLDSRALNKLKVAAIGSSTAAVLRHKGIIADCQPDVFTSQALVAKLENWNITGQYFLLPRSDIADKELIEGVTRQGAKVHEIAVYRTSPNIECIDKAKEILLSNQIDVVTFTSSSTVSNLVSFLGGKSIPNEVKIACIGPKTAETARKVGLNPDIVASEHTIPGLVNAIEEYFRKVM